MITSGQQRASVRRLLKLAIISGLISHAQAQSPRTANIKDIHIGQTISDLIVETGGTPKNTSPVTIHSIQGLRRWRGQCISGGAHLSQS